MANKWKYSTLPASERINRIRNGDKDVYDSEMARSLDVIKARQDIGLDTSEMQNWVDRVNYNYSLSNSDANKKTPADDTADDMEQLIKNYNFQRTYRSQNRPITVSNRRIEAEKKADELLNEYYEKVNNASKRVNYVKEWLMNNGIDLNSEDGQKYLNGFRLDLAEKVDKYKSEYSSKVKKLFDNI